MALASVRFLTLFLTDRLRVQDLYDAMRKYLAWRSILTEEAQLNLTTHQKRQVEQQLAAVDTTIIARLLETYQWLLIPTQSRPQDAMQLSALRLTGNGGLAAAAYKKLRAGQLYLTSFAPTSLKLELDRIPLWRSDQVSVKQLVEDFACYLSLPRLKNPTVLLQAISEGVNRLTWIQDGFGYADGYEDTTHRYQGLCGGTLVTITDSHSSALVVKAETASRQLDAERPTAFHPSDASVQSPTLAYQSHPTTPHSVLETPATTGPKRFHGTVVLDSTRVGRDAARIAEEVISHLSGLVGTTVTSTLEIEAALPNNVPDYVVRIVTENS